MIFVGTFMMRFYHGSKLGSAPEFFAPALDKKTL
jgi:hypothetical protein